MRSIDPSGAGIVDAANPPIGPKALLAMATGPYGAVPPFAQVDVDHCQIPGVARLRQPRDGIRFRIGDADDLSAGHFLQRKDQTLPDGRIVFDEKGGTGHGVLAVWKKKGWTDPFIRDAARPRPVRLSCRNG